MIERNKQVEEYLQSFYAMKMAPRFAVMLNGRWGSGKTWFIEQSIKSLRKAGGKAIYVSLYGKGSTRDIDEEIFRQLHPILGSKGMGLAGTLVKGLFRTSIGLDLFGDGARETTVKAEVPDVKWSEHFGPSDKHVLVFDDLERCAIDVSDLLGYVNYFVEHGNHKVVIVANETEIIKAEAPENAVKSNYERIREKLIGKTFEIQSDAPASLEAFLGEISSDSAANAIELHKNLISDLYRASGYDNLRNLRQAILEVARILNNIEVKHLGNSTIVKDIISQFLVLTFEIRGGILKRELIGSLSRDIEAAHFEYGYGGGTESDFKNNPLLSLEAKYAGFDWRNGTIPETLWSKFFETGLTEREVINYALDSSRYYTLRSQETWRSLWAPSTVSDTEFSVLLTKLDDEFNNRTFEDLGDLLHVVGLLLKIRSMGLYPSTDAEILRQGMVQAKVWASAAGSKLPDNNAWYLAYGHMSYGGFGFNSADKPVFHRFISNVQKQVEKARIARLPTEAADLCAALITDPDSFARSLAVAEAGSYYATPILAYMDVKAFVGAITMMDPGYRNRAIASAIRVRYATHDLRPLVQERAWLLKAAKQLAMAGKGRKGQISGIQLADMAGLFISCANQMSSEPKDGRRKSRKKSVADQAVPPEAGVEAE